MILSSICLNNIPEDPILLAMILHSQKLIFIHIPRTAGTSITKLLKKYFKVENIPEHLGLYKNALKEKGYSQKAIEKMVNSEMLKDDLMKYKNAKHATLSDYYDWYGEKKLEPYYKFTIARNPWDRMVSWYMNANDSQQFKNEKFYNWLKSKNNDNQIKFIKVNGKLVMDKIIRFEKLKPGLSDLFKEIGIPSTKISEIPLINKTGRGPYQDYYRDKSKRLVEKMFKKEIELFNYRYD